jgi:2-oxoglutarate ferredoxin oxidoreductase subunit alpha
MRENLVIPEAADIEIVNRARPDVPPDRFLPFKGGPNGVPPLPDFGDGYRILHSLNPHDEHGSIHWDPDVFERLYERITGKITGNRDDIVRTERFCLDNAQIGVIAYGSECRPALDAVQQARESGIRVGLLKLDTVWPVPEAEIRSLAEQCSTILAVEMNIGKYAAEVERVVGERSKVVRVTKNRGLVHTTGEILTVIEEVVG